MTTTEAQSSVEELLPSKLRERRAEMRIIESCVAEAFGLSIEELHNPGRQSWYTWPRQVSMALMRELTSAPLCQIAGWYNFKTHENVLHACRLVADQCRISEDMSNEIQSIRIKILTSAEYLNPK